MKTGNTMEIVDAQIHLWQGDGAPPHHRQQPYLIEDALAGMDEAGVDRVVNCPAIWDADANDYAVEAATRHPGRFATLGWFPLTTAPDPAAVEALLARPGMLGLRFVLASPDLIAALTTGGLDWLWQSADEREMPVALMVFPEHLPLLGGIAVRYPRMRLLIDHLAVLPFFTLPEAGDHFDALLDLGKHPNIAVKATGVPSMATDPYPFASTHDLLRRTFEAFGSERMFWGTDVTRMRCTWRQCVTSFTEELPWLTGGDLELVMGRGVRAWIKWP
ncbi:amidohydrolase family protein [Actinomadura scrupuli]|uniref:amidohydrolase family protein n=1 Tax=Actinomadura scrupuli TaxID=559629 RepID=UPI003D976E09